VAILATAQWTGCVPLSATGAVNELIADLRRCGPDLIIGPYSNGPLPESECESESESSSSVVVDPALSKLASTTNVLPQTSSARDDWTVHHHVKEVAEQLEIPFCGLVPDPNVAGPFKLWLPLGRKTKRALVYSELPVVPETPDEEDGLQEHLDNGANTGHDEALILFTSGTTGNKKLVPHQIGDLLTAATVIALSWRLQPTDVNCNMMPLFHVGGIVRQVFSPAVSNSCVICCPSFDAGLFWALLQRSAFNWYYAAPTMHQIILQTGQEFIEKAEGEKQPYKLKMIANAAGGLLPSLAIQLRNTFGNAYVLPSYGMTGTFCCCCCCCCL